MAIDLDRIQRELADFEFVDFHGGVPDEKILAAERAVGVSFGPEYRQFLRIFGAGAVSSEEFIGLGGPPHLDVVTIVKHLRSPSAHFSFPTTLVPLRNDGYGNYDCLDTAQDDAEMGPKVVFWQHDGGDQQDCPVLNRSYGTWLLATLAMIRELDAE